MNEKLQELTKKIYEEGLEKGKKEAEEILQNAKKEAEALIKDAHAEAAKITENATKEAEELRKNVKSELAMSAKQAITAIKQQITDLVLNQAVSSALQKSFGDKDFVKMLIQKMVENWNKIDTTNSDILLIVPESERKQYDDFFLGKLAGVIKSGIEINFEEGIKSGFCLSPKDGSYKISFTEQDFNQFFKQYLRPRTGKLLYGDK